MIFKSQGGDAWKLLQTVWKISRVIPVSTVNSEVALRAEGCSGWKCLKYRKWLMSPSCLAEPGGIRAGCSSCFLHSSVHCVLWVCRAAEGSPRLHQGCDGNVQAGEPDPLPFLPTPPHS